MASYDVHSQYLRRPAEKEGIPEVMEVMNAYCLTRADWDSVQDLTKFKGSGPVFQDPAAGIPTAVKSAGLHTN